MSLIEFLVQILEASSHLIVLIIILQESFQLQ
jgi:hypothetical protein